MPGLRIDEFPRARLLLQMLVEPLRERRVEVGGSRIDDLQIGVY